jgi:tetratricopeptide (TPR) repeat protein
MRRTRSALERAVKLVPADAYHHANLARFLGELSRTDSTVRDTALAEWRQALTLDPCNPYILAEAGRTALVVSDFTAAEQYAKRGTELYPTWAVFHAQIGAAALGREDYAAAVQGLELAMNADWHSDREALSRSLAMLASAEYRLHDFGKAQEFAGKASVWLPQWPAPHLLRAQALTMLGLRSEAMREMMIARALQGQPATAFHSP